MCIVCRKWDAINLKHLNTKVPKCTKKINNCKIIYAKREKEKFCDFPVSFLVQWNNFLNRINDNLSVGIGHFLVILPVSSLIFWNGWSKWNDFWAKTYFCSVFWRRLTGRFVSLFAECIGILFCIDFNNFAERFSWSLSVCIYVSVCVDIRNYS